MKSKVLNNECGQHRFHMLFKARPTLDIPRYLKPLKILITCELERKFSEVKEKLWSKALWSKSRFLATTGQASLGVLMAYFDSQGAE